MEKERYLAKSLDEVIVNDPVESPLVYMKLAKRYAEEIDAMIMKALMMFPRRRSLYFRTSSELVKRLIIKSCGFSIAYFQNEPGKVAIYRKGKMITGINLHVRINGKEIPLGSIAGNNPCAKS